MDHDQQAAKNFAWLTAAQIGVRFLGAAFFIFLSHKLNDTGIGQYSFIVSFVPFWFILIDFGGADYLYREWSRGKDKETIEHDFFVLFTARLILLTTTIIPFVAVNYFINHNIQLSLVLFFFSMFLAMLTGLAELYLRSVNQFRFVAIRQVIEKIAAVVFGVILLLFFPRLEMIFVAILLSQIVSLFYYYYFKALPFKFRLVFNWERSKELFRKGLPFLFIGIFAALYGRIDMTMLRYFRNFEAVGWYGAAYKFLEVSFLFPSLFLASIFPLLSSLYADGQDNLPDKFLEFFKKSFRILYSGGLLTALFFILFSPKIIAVFFPASFGPSALALRILIIGQTVAFLSALFNSILLIQRKENKALFIIIFCAVLNIGLNFFLIPRYSLYGAAWATVLAELANLALLQYFVKWHKDIFALSKMGAVILFNVVILTILKMNGQMNNLWLGTAILLTNLAILFTVKLLEKQDIKLFLEPFVNKLKILKI